MTAVQDLGRLLLYVKRLLRTQISHSCRPDHSVVLVLEEPTTWSCIIIVLCNVHIHVHVPFDDNSVALNVLASNC